MTNEELDRARAEEARKQQYDIGANNMLDVLAYAARLAREGWTPPVPVDPDLAEAELFYKALTDLNYNGAETFFLQAIKRGRALAAAEAKPGLVWVKHDGSGKCPVCPDGMVIVIYIDIRNSIYGRAADRDWSCVGYYAEITPPDDVA